MPPADREIPGANNDVNLVGQLNHPVRRIDITVKVAEKKKIHSSIWASVERLTGIVSFIAH
jgi:hypothetical protein